MKKLVVATFVALAPGRPPLSQSHHGSAAVRRTTGIGSRPVQPRERSLLRTRASNRIPTRRFIRLRCLGIAGGTNTSNFFSAPSATDKSCTREALLVGGTTAAVASAIVFPALYPKILSYWTLSNTVYLWRRSVLRKTTMVDIFRIRTTLEKGVSLRLFSIYLLAWQALVLVYPLTETVARVFGYASFFYSYPNAQGGGYIVEPLKVQELPGNKRAKEQMRLDWHRFKYNCGDIGRDGYKHPPSVERNLPHVDIPKRQIKHWPWRRRHFPDTRIHKKKPAV